MLDPPSVSAIHSSRQSSSHLRKKGKGKGRLGSRSWILGQVFQVPLFPFLSFLPSFLPSFQVLPPDTRAASAHWPPERREGAEPRRKLFFLPLHFPPHRYSSEIRVDVWEGAAAGESVSSLLLLPRPEEEEEEEEE